MFGINSKLSLLIKKNFFNTWVSVHPAELCVLFFLLTSYRKANQIKQKGQFYVTHCEGKFHWNILFLCVIVLIYSDTSCTFLRSFIDSGEKTVFNLIDLVFFFHFVFQGGRKWGFYSVSHLSARLRIKETKSVCASHCEDWLGMFVKKSTTVRRTPRRHLLSKQTVCLI